METALLILALVLVVVVLVMQWTLLGRVAPTDLTPVTTRLEAIERMHERSEKAVRDEIARNRDEASNSARQGREELDARLNRFGEAVQQGVTNAATLQKNQLDSFGKQLGDLTRVNETKLEAIRAAVDAKLQQIQTDNAKQLEQMRATVDEKLQGTLEKRLGESFKLVSERLELVHKGLGEMQGLALGVGDLKRVLTNVKRRGGWGEVQLQALLEQMLSPEQYSRNVQPKPGSRDTVDFAIKLPGQGTHPEQVLWLPVDSKFPLEDYQRLVDAQERADIEGMAEASKALAQRVRFCARDISEKYLAPPATTDFAIMFLPTEGLFAEVVRLPGFVEALQQEYRVTVAGPTTFAAFLTSLQMGFRTLAVSQRTSEVWELLGSVKSEFVRFGDTLDGVKKKLEEASNKIDDATRRSRSIEKKLRGVEGLPGEPTQLLLTDEP